MSRLLSKEQGAIFTVQKLTDMVSTKKIFRAIPPVGDEPIWWEQN